MPRIASFKNTAKAQCCVVYSDGLVIKDQLEWSITVKQGATTVHEDSASYSVSTSSLAMKVKTGAFFLCWTASRGDSRTTHAIMLTESLSLLQKQWNRNSRLALCQLSSTCTFETLVHILPRTCWVADKDRTDRQTGKATSTSGLNLERSEVLRNSRHYLQAQRQGHHAIDRLEERGVKTGSARRSSLK